MLYLCDFLDFMSFFVRGAAAALAVLLMFRSLVMSHFTRRPSILGPFFAVTELFVMPVRQALGNGIQTGRWDYHSLIAALGALFLGLGISQSLVLVSGAVC